jgi:TolB protein
LAVCGLLALPASAGATFPGKNGRIVYDVIGGSPSGLQSIDELGGDRRTYPYGGAEPNWSPDGMRLGFAAVIDEQPGIFTMNSDGSNLHFVAEVSGVPDWSGPSWSPDGNALVYSTENCVFPGCTYYVHRVKLDGSGHGVISYGTNPEWSPAGGRIAIERYDQNPFNSNIFTIDSGGDGDTRLTTSAGHDYGPEWSPEGDRIAFASNRDGNYEIYVMNADGTGQTRITNTAANETSPAWSPDGTKIVFERMTHPNPFNCYAECNASIYKVNADGSGEVRLTTDGTNALWPDWGPAASGHARPRSATPVNVTLAPAAWQCIAANARHGGPLDVSSCSPASHPSDWVTIGSPEANGMQANSVGSVRLKVRSCPQCASPLPPDVIITANITDVRNRYVLTDYTGELEGVVHIRLTDNYNGPPYDRSGTVPDVPLSFAMSCAATDDVTIGSTCAANTSANAIMPGLVRDFARAVWQLGPVEVNDGGPDGDAETQDNTPFMVQGLFAP